VRRALLLLVWEVALAVLLLVGAGVALKWATPAFAPAEVRP
jgi:hypothetical protein